MSGYDRHTPDRPANESSTVAPELPGRLLENTPADKRTTEEDDMENTATLTPANTTGSSQPGTWKSPTVRELLEELKLGVDGQDKRADSDRLAKAKEMIKDFEEKSERAYAAARWPEEPWLAEPFGAALLVRHGGNLSAVVADPAFEDTLITAMGLDPYEQSIPDEDGGREERIEPAETVEGRQEIADMMTALRDALTAEPVATDTPGVESVLGWARQHEPALYNAYHETFTHVGEEEPRAETLVKLTERADQYAQRALQTARERTNGIETMMALGRPDLVEIAGRTGLNTLLNEQNITPRLIAALEQATAIDSLYEAAALTYFQGPLEMVERWDDEAQAPYSIAKIVLDKERSDLELSAAETDAMEEAMDVVYEGYDPTSETDVDEPVQEGELSPSFPEPSDKDIRFQLSLDAYDLRRNAFEALGMTETDELSGPPQTGEVLRLDQLRRTDGTIPTEDEANAYLMVVGDPEPEVTLGIKDWAQRGYRALPGTLRPSLEHAPQTRPTRSATIKPGNVIITPEGDRQHVIAAKREGLNVKITFNSNINPSQQEELTIPAYRRLQIEQTAGAGTPQPQEPSGPQSEHHQEVIHTTQTPNPGIV